MRSIELAAYFLMLSTSAPMVAYSQEPQTTFVPEVVFAGQSQGQGELQLLFGEARTFTVHSVGARQNDGSFRLDQEVRFTNKPVEHRTWVVQQVGPGHYLGSLTGAAGPVTAQVQGRRMSLQYPLNNWGLKMEQTMDLTREGNTVNNYGKISFLGIQIGELREIIRLNQ